MSKTVGTWERPKVRSSAATLHRRARAEKNRSGKYVRSAARRKSRFEGESPGVTPLRQSFARFSIPPSTRSAMGCAIGPADDQFENHANQFATLLSRSDHQETAARSVIQRKPCAGPSSAAESEANAAPKIVHDVLNSPGRALEMTTREFFEPRLGRDLGGVRVHTDDQAAASASAVGASAYTVGRDVVFGRNQYAPTSQSGRHLLAHELAHVAQQETGPVLRRQPTQSNTAGPDTETLIKKFVSGQISEEERNILARRLRNNELSQAQIDAVTDAFGKQLAAGVVNQALNPLQPANQLNVTYPPKSADAHKYFKATLEMHSPVFPRRWLVAFREASLRSSKSTRSRTPIPQRSRSPRPRVIPLWPPIFGQGVPQWPDRY